MTVVYQRICLRLKMQKKKDVKEETLDELEQKTYMSYLSKSRGRVKSKPSVSKSRGHAIKKTPEIHKRLFGDKAYEKHMKKMSEDALCRCSIHSESVRLSWKMQVIYILNLP